MSRIGWRELLYLVGVVGVVIWGNGPIGILVGVVLAWVLGSPAWSGKATKTVLAVSVVGLGAGMNLSDVLAVGGKGLLLTAGTITLTLGLGYLLNRWVKLPIRLATLITVGTAICGGSAIAAIAPIVRAKSSEIAASLGVVFTLNALALYVFPAVGQALQMDAQSFGTWSAFAIHDTSSVVGAAATHSAAALDIATVSKLSRALWIAPVGLLISFLVPQESENGKVSPRVKVPLFIWLFLAMVLLVTLIPEVRPAGQVAATAARKGMVAALFLVGLSLNRETFKTISGKAILFGSSLWVVLAVGTLFLFK
ncbi:MAG: putative integral membrane protein (TIGR00698 family) [Candidatus Krumholzibacteriia bacterium]|jgi:uncharacterized integral membrane protein (TIGR00698 family)